MVKNLLRNLLIYSWSKILPADLTGNWSRSRLTYSSHGLTSQLRNKYICRELRSLNNNNYTYVGISDLISPKDETPALKHLPLILKACVSPFWVRYRMLLIGVISLAKFIRVSNQITHKRTFLYNIHVFSGKIYTVMPHWSLATQLTVWSTAMHSDVNGPCNI